jgi:hypothetical protein
MQDQRIENLLFCASQSLQGVTLQVNREQQYYSPSRRAAGLADPTNLSNVLSAKRFYQGPQPCEQT